MATGKQELNVEKFIVPKAPPKAFYIPNFITEEEEQKLLDKVYTAPKPKWKTLANRRLQNWGGLPHPKGMLKEPLPEWLESLVQRVVSLGVFEDVVPNHVLVNEYLPGQGIMPHEDGPLFYPTITTVNLGSHTMLDFHHKRESDQFDPAVYAGSLLLEPRSLLILQESLYHNYLHSIAERAEDEIHTKIFNLSSCPPAKPGDILFRDTRISLTIRHVPKTKDATKILGKFFPGINPQ